MFVAVTLGKGTGRGPFKLLKRPARFSGRLLSQRRVRFEHCPALHSVGLLNS
jgi:hypothetical protein